MMRDRKCFINEIVTFKRNEKKIITYICGKQADIFDSISIILISAKVISLKLALNEENYL